MQLSKHSRDSFLGTARLPPHFIPSLIDQPMSIIFSELTPAPPRREDNAPTAAAARRLLPVSARALPAAPADGDGEGPLNCAPDEKAMPAAAPIPASPPSCCCAPRASCLKMPSALCVFVTSVEGKMRTGALRGGMVLMLEPAGPSPTLLLPLLSRTAGALGRVHPPACCGCCHRRRRRRSVRAAWVCGVDGVGGQSINAFEECGTIVGRGRPMAPATRPRACGRDTRHTTRHALPPAALGRRREGAAMTAGQRHALPAR